MTAMTDPARRRSSAWLDAGGVEGLLRRGYLRTAGLSEEDLTRPVIGIAQTWSELNPCHLGLREVAEDVASGVRAAGGTPLQFPTMSLGEPFLHPTSMYLRNLMAMETEELIRAQPLDGVVLLGGCDKTVPAQLMAAASVDLPAVLLTTGPSLPGNFQGRRLGACTDCRRLWLENRAGTLSDQDLRLAEGSLSGSAGVCTVMGTAGTMATLLEVLGVALPGTATIPATDPRRTDLALRTGQAAVAAVRAGLRPSDLLTGAAFRDATTVLNAVGGSTNAVIHLLAIAGRTATEFGLDDIAEALTGPVLIDVRPAGAGLMEDFDQAGGVAALLSVLADRLDLDRPTVAGGTLRQHLQPVSPGSTAIHTPEDPVHPGPGLRLLRGSLAPGGAMIKVAAASPALLRHRGPAVVFDGVEDMRSRMDDPELPVTPDSVLILRGVGPVGGPGMPEAGFIPIPLGLARQGVTDMLRITDGRMSGTAFGTIVLHVTPESARQGPLARVRDGDIISFDAEAGTIDVDVDHAEFVSRAVTPPPARPERGWDLLFANSVLGADRGVDLDFLVGGSGAQPRGSARTGAAEEVQS